MLEMIVKNTKSATREKARRVEEHKFTVNTQEIDSRIKQLEQRIKEYESPKTQCMVPADRLSDIKIMMATWPTINQMVTILEKHRISPGIYC